MDIRIPWSSGIVYPQDNIECSIRTVSFHRYNHNVSAHVETVGTNRRSALIRVKLHAGTGGSGSRRSASGRRGPWACWHVFRDVLTCVFEDFPDATVHTALAVYKGRADFHRSFPATYHHEARAAGNSYDFGSLCACESDEYAEDSEIGHAYAVMERAQIVLDAWPRFDAVGLPILERG